MLTMCLKLARQLLRGLISRVNRRVNSTYSRQSYCTLDIHPTCPLPPWLKPLRRGSKVEGVQWVPSTV